MKLNQSSRKLTVVRAVLALSCIGIMGDGATNLVNASIVSDEGTQWYRVNFWTGEYPEGISVIEPNLTVDARSEAKLSADRNVSCKLPYKAVYHVWNTKRNRADKVEYSTLSRIIPMFAKEDFNYSSDDISTKLSFRKGDLIEFLIYEGEGFFRIRFKGRIYDAEFSLLEKVVSETDPWMTDSQYWVRVKCENGMRAFLLLSDLVKYDKSGRAKYVKGLHGAQLVLDDYGLARDLNEEEAAQLRKE